MKENAKQEQVKLTIDDQEVSVDASLTILEAARQNGLDIPTLCHHPALSNWGGCRLCVVEVDKSPKLVASCVMPVRNGMEVVTDNAAITASRRMTLELLFAERNHNCMFCPDSGQCELQKMAYALQMDHLTVSQSFARFPTDVTGEYMTIDHNRCILCGRCVRGCQEIAGCHVLGFHNRGPKTLVGFDLLEPREASTCINCGACLQVCPTGAISSRYRTHYAVKGQPAERDTIASLCAGCGLLCPTLAVVRDNQLIKIEGFLSGTDGRPDRGQLCYKGRFEVLKTQGERLLVPMVKESNGRWREQSWEKALNTITERLTAMKLRNGASELFGFVSGALSNESLMLFKELMVDGWGTRSVDTLDGDRFRSLVAIQGNGAKAAFKESSWDRVGRADMILVVGVDLQKTHPMLLSLLRRAHIEDKRFVAAIGTIEGAALFSSDYLPVEENDLPAVLALLGGKAGASAKPAKGKPVLSSEQHAALQRIAQAYATAQAPLIFAGSHPSGSAAAKGLAELYKLVRVKEGRPGQNTALVVLKPSANSAGAWRLGVAARSVPINTAGGGLLLLGEERGEALGPWQKGAPAPDFLAVITPYFDTALAEIAEVLLPRPLWLEEDGTYTGMDGAEIFFKPKVLDPPKGVKPTWEILNDLAQRIDAPGAARSWQEIRTKAGQLLTVD
jgi:formate dehydrogenase major subunit